MGLHKIALHSQECKNAEIWLLNKNNNHMWPRICDFEKEFRCKIHEEDVLFQNEQDYTWFLLKWGS